MVFQGKSYLVKAYKIDNACRQHAGTSFCDLQTISLQIDWFLLVYTHKNETEHDNNIRSIRINCNELIVRLYTKQRTKK